ncbi:GGDEF domain-containing protein [Halioglobus maricola]|uniref:diguanylate cyclase n=1 Tax=Halioglobus maricola TaxID=2601894 RepID=A0A5P9NLW2_9GAMM|nr:GGDEF domain-containing protein [Halioglobus maricola]QFU76742.1 GGDEF domain-containing protein [Halioglobus maricola]
MRVHLSAGYRLVVPLLLVALAMWARSFASQLGQEASIFLDYLPYFLCLICCGLAWMFNRLRLALAALASTGLYLLIKFHLQVSLTQPAAGQLFLFAGLALAVGITYLLVVRDYGLLTLRSLLMVVVFTALLGLCYAASGWIGTTEAVWAEKFAAPTHEEYMLSRAVSWLIAGAALVAIYLVLARDDETESALFGALLAGFCALAFLHLEYISVVMACAGLLSVGWGLLRGSHSMAYRDELTGLPGRRALNERLQSLGRNYSIAMVDVDHFKKFNDTHGHDVGDEVLKLVASRIRRVGGGGTAYRYGGEEFCVVFPRKSADECAGALDKAREGISNYRMSIRDQGKRPVKAKEGTRRRGATRLSAESVYVTVSAGIANRDDDLQTPEEVLAAADKQLYRAKRGGRNRVAWPGSRK